ncbi:hypothetical protein K443DRAFT_14514 [Laccaria amethystina LaAM-08-1]|uniref:Uncharacterized protein n=1 Tax=Laccaria amethystina LaAM-08-1 TaxID=1095629 RepID=A0A0C9WSZ0_9AGAR|nr:hypothetical protein K443DRAFT_14514 [Laccaria amethystina LaAM-08-1]
MHILCEEPHRQAAYHQTLESINICLIAELAVLKDQHASVEEKRGSEKKPSFLGEMSVWLSDHLDPLLLLGAFQLITHLPKLSTRQVRAARVLQRCPGNPVPLYADAVSLAQNLRDRCPAIDASLSEAFTDNNEDTPVCASAHISSSCGKPVAISNIIRAYNVAPTPTALQCKCCGLDGKLPSPPIVRARYRGNRPVRS